MTAFKPEEYQEKKEKVIPFEMHIVSYKLDNTYYCTVDNVNPGAVIARTQGKTREEAESGAITKAREALNKTRVLW